MEAKPQVRRSTARVVPDQPETPKAETTPMLSVQVTASEEHPSAPQVDVGDCDLDATGGGVDISSADGDEWECVDETLVYANCSGVVESGIVQPGRTVRFVGLDSASPLIQIGPAIFQGSYSDAVGTLLLFEKCSSNVDANPPAPSTSVTTENTPSTSIPNPSLYSLNDSATSQHTKFRYSAKTMKQLNLNRVFLKLRDGIPDPNT